MQKLQSILKESLTPHPSGDRSMILITLCCLVIGVLFLSSVAHATTVFSDGFEGSFPGGWVVGNNNSNTVAKWGDNNAKAYVGSWSAFCADNGTSGRTTYDNGLNTYMQRQNVSLAGFTNAVLSFRIWINTEPTYDYFEVNVRNQSGVWTNKLRLSGNQSASAWQLIRVNLDAYAGQTGLIISFDFVSDGSVVPSGAAGVWIDEVSLDATSSCTSADLALSGMTVTWSSPTSGSHPTDVQFDLCNNGSCPLVSPNTYVMVDFYLSTNTTFGDADDISIGNNGYDFTLASGACTHVTLSATGRSYITWPSGKAGQCFYVYGKVRHASPSTLTDPVAGNNYTRTSGTICEPGCTSADLALSGMTVTWSSPTSGSHPTDVQFDLCNNGSCPLVSPNTYVMVDFYLSTNTTFGDADDISIGNNGYDFTLASGACTHVTLSATGRSYITWPSGKAGQCFYVYGKVRHASPSTLTDPVAGNNYTRTSGTICEPGTPCFTFTSNTGNSYSIVVDSASLVSPVVAGDEVGVFDGSLCVGASVFSGTWPLGLTAWQDDSRTTAKDGYTPGNPMLFKKCHNSLISDLCTPHITRGDGNFGTGDYAELWIDCGDTCQTLNLQAGWNFVSLNVTSPSLAPLDIFAPCVSSVNIIKSCDGSFCIPGLICNVAQWDMKKAYWVHMKSPYTLDICGSSVPCSTPIVVQPGWNCISYLPVPCIDAPTAMTSIQRCLAIAKNGQGQFYIPGLINNMGPLCPGQGYQVYMNCVDTVIYPCSAPLAKTAEAEYVGAACQFYASPGVSGDFQPILVEATGMGLGDEIGIFTSEGLLVGGGVYEGGVVPVAARADDPQTPEVDGYQPGGELLVRVWDHASGLERRVEYAVTRGGRQFESAPYLALKLNLKAAEAIPALVERTRPNPFNSSTVIEYAMREAGPVRLTVYNILGQPVITLVDEAQAAGPHAVTWDGRDGNGRSVPSGVYFYRLATAHAVAARKIVLMK